MWLLSQDSDCWFPVSDQGKNGFVNQAGKLAFPLQPYALSGIRDGVLVANERGGDQGGWIMRMEPYRIAPVFPYGRSGLMNLQGEWVLPMGNQVIGYMGHGIWWACKGGKIGRYCTEAPHVEGGSYALVNAKGVLIDSLDDIALGFVDGCTPVFRRGRIALMDTAGRMVTGFEFDKAISNHLGTHHFDKAHPDDRLWKLALRRVGGDWVVLQQNGSLTEVDWPAVIRSEERGVGWRKQASLWIVTQEYYLLPCRMDLNRRRLERYFAKDLSYAENFPTDEFLQAKCQELRAAGLREIGLKVLEKDGRRALATLKGKPLTPYGYDYFEMRKGGFVAVYHTELPPKRPAEKRDDIEELEEFGGGNEDPDKPQTKVGLLDRKGKEVLPPHFEEINVHPGCKLIDGDYGALHDFFDYGGKKLDMGVAPWFEGEKEGYWSMGSYHLNRIYGPQMRVVVEDSNELRLLDVKGNWLWYASNGNAHYGKQLKGDSLLGPLYVSQLPEEKDRWLFRLPKALTDSSYFSPAGDGYWKFDLNGKEGLMDSTGKVVVQPAFDGVELTYYGIELRNGPLFGLMDLSGNQILPINYTEIRFAGCGFYSLWKEENGRSVQAIQDSNGRTIMDWK